MRSTAEGIMSTSTATATPGGEQATTTVDDAPGSTIATTTTTLANALAQTIQSIISSTTSQETTTTTTTTTSTVSSAQSPTITTTGPFTTTTTGRPEKLSVSDLSHTLQHFGIVDYLVFIAMLAVCAVIGFYFGFIEKKQKRKQQGQQEVPTDEKDGAGAAGIEERRGSEALDYLVGGRKMKVFPVALSLVAR